MNYGERATLSSRLLYIISATQMEQRFRVPNSRIGRNDVGWSEKGSIYPVFIGDTGRKRNLLAKRSQ